MDRNVEDWVFSDENLEYIHNTVILCIKNRTGKLLRKTTNFINDIDKVVRKNLDKPKTQSIFRNYPAENAIGRFNDSVIDEFTELCYEKIKSQIKPKESENNNERKKPNTKPFVIHIDSDNTIFDDETQSYEYTISLTNILEVGVKSIELINNCYNINKNCNVLKVDDKCIVVEDGEYSIQSLINTLNVKLKNEYIVNLDEITSKITIQTTTNSAATMSLGDTMKLKNRPFELNFDCENSIYRILGFKKELYQNKTKYTAENLYYLNKLSILYFTISFVDDTVNNVEIVDKIHLDNDKHTTKFHTSSIPLVELENTHSFKKIVMKLTDSFGNIYDLNGRQFSISLSLVSLRNF